MSHTISDTDFEILCDYIHKSCGILLKSDKKYLINNRLGPFLEKCSCANFNELASKINSLSLDLKKQLITKITTNETFFYRDEHPFKALREQLLPDCLTEFKEIQKSQLNPFSKIKIWSLASSTGQEAYSIAMDLWKLCEQDLSVKYSDFEILGTDISPDVLAKATAGLYSDLDIKRGLTEEQVKEFFQQEDKSWRIDPKLQSNMKFSYLNLIESPSVFINNFKIIFCRNVLIYFDLETKEKILDFIYQKLSPNGSLIIGASESLYGLKHPFKSKRIGQTTVYHK